MNPFSYKLTQIQKALIAIIPLAFVVLSMVVGWIPPLGFENAVLALVGPAFLVIGVFAAKNHTADDLQKALEALKGAVLTVIAYWTQVPTDLDHKITLGIVLLVSVIGVWWKANGARQ